MPMIQESSALQKNRRKYKEQALLQADLDKLSDWVKLWRSESNIKKCRTIHFCRNNLRGHYHMCGIDGVGK